MRPSVVTTVIKTSFLADGYDSSNDTLVEKSIKNALKWSKCVKVNLRNKDTFSAITVEDALQAFTNIFGEENKGIALQICQP
eukprot:scaffold16349_cov146-Skeletonema_menzelii.AAC.1